MVVSVTFGAVLFSTPFVCFFGTLWVDFQSWNLGNSLVGRFMFDSSWLSYGALVNRVMIMDNIRLLSEVKRKLGKTNYDIVWKNLDRRWYVLACADVVDMLSTSFRTFGYLNTRVPGGYWNGYPFPAVCSTTAVDVKKHCNELMYGKLYLVDR